MPVETCQLLVVAGGKGGKTLAMDMAHAGWCVAIVERSPEMLGGTCINLACIPSKTLIRSGEGDRRTSQRSHPRGGDPGRAGR